MAVRSTANLFMRPLATEALSGEFRPPSDPQRRKHTLARLAVATFTDGEGEVTSTGVIVRRRPLWAPVVEASVECDRITGTDGSDNLILSALKLRDPRLRGASLSITFPTELSWHTPEIIVIDSATDARLALGLNEGPDWTRTLITDAAQRFFDSAVELPVSRASVLARP